MKSKQNLPQKWHIKSLCTLTVLFFLVISLNASTTISAGDISGTWTFSGSPYLIEGNIVIPSGQSLTIEPGVVVELQSWYQISVYGDIQAIGTATQQIVFTATPPGPGEPAWPGIDIFDATINSTFEHCIIENGQSRGAEPNKSGGALYIQNSNPVLRYCTLRNNNVSRYGGAIYCDGSSPLIEGCTITNNSTTRAGGAIYCTNNSQPQIIGNIISNNSATAYGTFTAVDASGGGIYLTNSDAILKDNIISNNTVYATGNIPSHARGAAIYVNSSNPVLTGNTIYGNEASGANPEGGAIYAYYSDLFLVNNILWNDAPEEISITSYGYNSILVAYSDLQGGQSGILVDNSTVYWQEGNINNDPLFTDTDQNDFTLQAGSPAIDAGIAYYSWQGNVLINLGPSEYSGSAPDMGAQEYGGTGGANQSPVAEASASPDHGSSPLTVNFSSTGSYDPDGTITNYNWDFGDGNSSSELNPEHTFVGVNQYSVRLTVTDNKGATNTKAIIINVQDGTTLTGGEVSGIWNLAGSPYRIEGDINIPTGASLSIEPGVIVEFVSWYKLVVYGTLEAIGSATDSVLFTGTSVSGWIGIDFNNASNGSILNYCILENGMSRGASPNDNGGVLNIVNSDPTIINSNIRNNEARYDGGAIYLDGSNARIESCKLTNNSAKFGGAIYATNNSRPEIIGNTISYNSTSAFGGFGPATSSGGAIYLDQSNAIIDKNIISYNSVNAEGNVPTYARGGAIYIYYSDPILTNNTIYGNSAALYTTPYEGGALYVYGSNPVAVNNIFWNNSPEEIFFSESGSNSILLAYSDVQGGEEGIVTNGNANIYWQEGNISNDPQFADESNNNFELLSSSPVVNAGTPFYQWQGNTIIDLDISEYSGSAPDMGAIESLFTQPVNQSPVAIAEASPLSGDAPLLVQFSSANSYDPDGSITGYLWSTNSISTTQANPSYTFSTPGTYNITLEVTDNNGATSSDMITIEVKDAALEELHVSGQTLTRQRYYYYNRVVDNILIFDQDDQPVSSALVTANYNGPTNGTIQGYTGSDGIVQLYSNIAWRPSGTWCFEVTNVSKAGYEYNEAANVVTYQCEGSATGTLSLKSSSDFETISPETSVTNKTKVSIYPNPFNEETNIRVFLPEDQHVKITIFNNIGKIERVLIDENSSAGTHEIKWDGLNDSGQRVSKGLYFMQVYSGKEINTYKLLLK